MDNVFFYKKRSVNRGTQNNTLGTQNNTHSTIVVLVVVVVVVVLV